MTLVSVIMPYYKKKKYLEKSILSVLNQTYKNFEIILINDDPSEDKNFLINIKKLDNRIIILHNKTRLGAGFSRNKGIKRAKGNYLAFLDCDDYWHKDKLRKQLNFMITRCFCNKSSLPEDINDGLFVFLSKADKEDDRYFLLRAKRSL